MESYNDKEYQMFIIKIGLKILRILSIIFLIFLTLLEMYCFIHYLNNFFNGFTKTDILGNKIGDTVYGFEAIKQDGWANLFFIPLIVITTLYQIFYLVVFFKNLKKKKNGNDKNINIENP